MTECCAVWVGLFSRRRHHEYNLPVTHLRRLLTQDKILKWTWISMQILHGEPLNIKLHFGLNCARRQVPSKIYEWVCFSNGNLIFNFGWLGFTKWKSHKNECSGNNFYVLCNVLIKNAQTNYIKSPSSKYWLIMPSRKSAPPFPCFRHKLVRARNMNLSTAAAAGFVDKSGGRRTESFQVFI